MKISNLVINGKTVKKVGVFGLGKSNAGVVDYISRKYDNVIFYLRSDKPIEQDDGMRVKLFKEIYKDAHAYEEPEEDILFLSPSVRWDKAELSPFKDRGAILSSDADFFFKNFKDDVFAISGSDGKSTTSTLTYLLLTERYSPLSLCGNIGSAMTPLLSSYTQAAVSELSSFQLMNISPRSRRALITNITPNHLDWHTSFEEYVRAKENIYTNAEERVFCCDFTHTKELVAKYTPFALYSLYMPEKELRAISKSEVYIYLEDGYITANGERLLSIDDISAKGMHNVSNFMAAIAMSYGLISKQQIVKVAKEFKGLRHRNMPIYRKSDITFYDSSIDSTPKRTVTTILSHSERLTLILGGKSKALPYDELCEPIKQKVGTVVITGENQREIYDALCRGKVQDSGVRILLSDSFDKAVISAINSAKSGESVLLSPASTSYDTFKNFEERGDAFATIVKNFYGEP